MRNKFIGVAASCQSPAVSSIEYRVTHMRKRGEKAAKNIRNFGDVERKEIRQYPHTHAHTRTIPYQHTSDSFSVIQFHCALLISHFFLDHVDHHLHAHQLKY